MNNIGEAIKEHRLEAGATLQQVQEQTGISNQNLSRWENGKAIPGIDFCIKLAKYYNCTLDELVGLTDNLTPIQKVDLPIKQSESAVGFINEYADILADNNFIQTAKLYKAITPELRALAFGYLVGILQSQGINTQQVLKY